MSESRYYVRHDDQSPGGTGEFPSIPAISYIRDRWYCCRDVARITRRPYRLHRGEGTTRSMRARAERVCAEMNAEHEAWLAANLPLDKSGPEALTSGP